MEAGGGREEEVVVAAAAAVEGEHHPTHITRVHEEKGLGFRIRVQGLGSRV